MNAVKAQYDYYHGYFLADKEGYDMRYPFGFGLSYTEFELKNLRVSAKAAREADTVKVLVDVTNTGNGRERKSYSCIRATVIRRQSAI